MSGDRGRTFWDFMIEREITFEGVLWGLVFAAIVVYFVLWLFGAVK
jgi:hypothetical protein